jgi:hypothetical protein
MDNNRESRGLWIVIALVVGFAFGYLVRGPKGGGGGGDTSPTNTATATPASGMTATPTPVPLLPTKTCVPLTMGGGNRSVVVGPDIALCDPDCLTMTKLDTISWAGITSNALWIEFEEKPFQTMSAGGVKKWRADCLGNTCRSGAVIATPPGNAYPCPDDPSKKCWGYKYWQIFHPPTGPNVVADGRIIIRW